MRCTMRGECVVNRERGRQGNMQYNRNTSIPFFPSALPSLHCIPCEDLKEVKVCSAPTNPVNSNQGNEVSASRA